MFLAVEWNSFVVISKQPMRILLFITAVFTFWGTAIFAQAVVFPGDANRDGRVDHYDVLPIGFAYGSLGPTRNPISNQEAQPILAHWSGIFPNGINFIHADVNANGLVEILDFVLLSQNQGLTFGEQSAFSPTSTPGSSTAPVLRLGSGDSLDPDLVAGQTLSIPITVEQSLAGNWLNGLAFTLNYDPQMVSSASFTFATEWLGEAGESFRFKRNEPGKIRVALTRFGSNPVAGDGIIGTLELVIIEDLVGFLPTIPGTVGVIANVEGVVAVNGAYQTIPMNETPLVTQPVNALLSNEDRQETDAFFTLVSPNPTEETINVSSLQTFDSVELIDLNGRTQLLYNGPNVLTWSGRVDNQPAGLYYLRTRGAQGLSITPLVFQ